MESELARQPSRWWTHAFFALPLVAFLHPAIFAFDDDFMLLRLVRWEPFPWIHNLVMSEGRPLFALILRFTFALFPRLEDLIWLRLFGVAGTVLTAYLLAHFAVRRLHLAPGPARLGAVLLVLTPGMGVYTFWSITGPFAWSAALGVAGGALTWRGWNTTSHRNWRLILGGMALGLCSELIYQPTAGFFLVPPLLAATVTRERRHLDTSIRTFASFVVILGFYFVAFKISASTVFAGYPNAVRGGHISPENFFQYVGGVMPMVAAGWGIFWGEGMIRIVHGFLLLGGFWWILWSRRHTGNLLTIGRVGIWLGAVVLAGAPLLGSGTFAPFRTVSAVTAVLVLPLLIGWWKALNLRHLAAWRLPLATVGALAVALIARYVVETTVIAPTLREYQVFREAFRQDFDELPSSLTVVAPNPPYLRGLNRFLEYGSRSSKTDWQTNNMVTLFLAEQLELPRGGPQWTLLTELTPIIVLRAEDNAGPLHASGPVVNFPERMGDPAAPKVIEDAQATPETLTLPSFGEVQAWPSGWYFAEGFGRFRQDEDGWVEHAQMGWVRVISFDANAYYVYSRLFGKVTGYRAWWPWVELHDLGTKLHLEHFASERNLSGSGAWELLSEVKASRAKAED